MPDALTPDTIDIEPVGRTARKRLGEILIERGKLDPATLERALRLQAEAAKGSARCW